MKTVINFSTCKDFDDFKKQQDSILNDAEKTIEKDERKKILKILGNNFEKFIKLYLQIDPVYKSKLKKIWLLKDVPLSILEHLNIPSNDYGIDIIAETYNNKYWAIQCKYHTDDSGTISHREIATFNALVGKTKKFSYSLICTTVNSYDKKLFKHFNDIGWCLGDKFNACDKKFFKKIHSLIKQKPIILTPEKPRFYQNKSIKEAYKYFITNKNNRGKLIMPCGTGKTLTSFWIIDKLKANKIIIAVPSLYLIRQTLTEYVKESMANKQKMDWLCVCSDETAGVIDSPMDIRQDLGVPCTTDIDKIKEWLNKKTNGKKVIFTTYQSSRVLAKAAKDYKFDIGIMDEAHKTAGSINKLFSHLLHEKNIKIKHRIFMTATERRYIGSSDEILSMDDPEIYGDTFDSMSFKEAIEGKGNSQRKILSDYKIITMPISKEEIKEQIIKNKHVIPKGWDKEAEAQMLASSIATKKAMKKYPIKHLISFHSSIKRSTIFKECQEKYNSKVENYHVSSKIPTARREKMVRDFVNSPKAIMSNARCLTEGADIPIVDGILFSDPKRSTIDITQAMGRALRKYDGKEFSYIIVPTIIKNKKDFIKSKAWDDILMLLRALGSLDERIVAYFKAKANGKNFGGGSPVETFEKLADIIDIKDFDNSIYMKAWGRLAKLSWMPFKKAREFAISLGFKGQKEWFDYCRSGKKPFDIPTNPQMIYKNKGWKDWGDWFGTNYIATRKRIYKSFSKVRNFVRELKLKDVKEWKKYCKSGEKPSYIPSNPNLFYKNKGWVNWPDFLGTNGYNRSHLSFEKAKKCCMLWAKKFKKRYKRYPTLKDWNVHHSQDRILKPIQKSLYSAFSNNPKWKGFNNFLGIPNHIRNTWGLEKVKTYLKLFKIKSTEHFKHLYNNGYIDRHVPKDLSHAFKNEKKYKKYGTSYLFLSHSHKRGGYMPIEKYRKLLKQYKITSIKGLKKNKILPKETIDGFVTIHPWELYNRLGTWINWPYLFYRNTKASYKLTKIDALNIRKNKKLTYSKLAKLYNISISNVCDIKKRRIWKHV